ncbi:ATP phosphoribosyltransferase regulatory subunit [Bienertia sinuspersici]
MLITISQVEKLLEAFTIKPKKPPKRKLQRSPKIIGYERECSDEMSTELNEPLLCYEEKSDYSCNDQGKINNKSSNNISENKNVRVKVLLTKDEASKLLAKCKEEGVLDFKDVVMELGKLPAQRIDVSHVGVTRFANSCKDLELATIVEEEEEEENEL